MLIHPADQVPKTSLLTTLIPTLSELLISHNEQRPHDRFRLRTVLHAGEVHYDQRGMFGEDLDLALRLLDAPEVKNELRRTTAPLVLVVSNNIYMSIVRHGYDGIDARTFEPVVDMPFGERRERGWVSPPAQLQGQSWSFHPVTGDPRTDTLLHRAGQELDAKAAVKSRDPTAVVAKIFNNQRLNLPGAG